MSRTLKYVTVMVMVANVAVVGLAQPAPAVAPGDEPRHASGIALAGPESYQAKPASERQAAELDRARERAKSHPDDLGYPWIGSDGQLTERTVTYRGRDIVRAGATQTTPLSYRKLESIKDEVIDLPDADSIQMSSPDDWHNRIIITVNRISDRLMHALAARYGTEAVAVRVRPGMHIRQTGNRQQDWSPFSGGAAFKGGIDCTLGFPWTTGFMTAGHCLANGGDSFSPDGARVGGTEAAVDENYDNGVGTTYLPGESVYRGDLAQIRTSNPSTLNPQIYVGDKDSSTKVNIAGIWNRSAAPDDQYCTGGRNSGELCGWTVLETRDNIYPSNGGTTRNVVWGARWDGREILEGDSGGPVYTTHADGKVVAKGITDASGWNIGVDFHYFTDIWDASCGFPGALKTSSGIGPGTFDRDGIGYYNPGDATFHLHNALSSGSSNYAFPFGPTNAYPVAGDWDGDGKDGIGYYYPSDGTFHLHNALSSGSSNYAFPFGPAYRLPVIGDWDGDGRDSIGYYDAGDATFHLSDSLASGPSDYTFPFGPSDVLPVVGDWDGDGRDSIGVYRQSDAKFFLSNCLGSRPSVYAYEFSFGPANMIPVAGDWDGDGRDGIGYYNPSDGTFHLSDTLASGSSTYSFPFGPTGAKPVIGDWDGL